METGLKRQEIRLGVQAGEAGEERLLTAGADGGGKRRVRWRNGGGRNDETAHARSSATTAIGVLSALRKSIQQLIANRPVVCGRFAGRGMSDRDVGNVSSASACELSMAPISFVFALRVVALAAVAP
jgi:hypothetical protein